MNNKNIALFNNMLPIVFLQKCNTEINFTTQIEDLSFLLKILKKSILFQFAVLASISGIDYHNAIYRFGVAYDIYSIKFNLRLRVSIFIDYLEEIDSITNIFPSANWWEREVWDLFGLFFKNHPDLRRILLDYGFEGHPMRKDYPVYGLTELYYNIEEKRILIVPTELSQEYRLFSFDTPWENGI